MSGGMEDSHDQDRQQRIDAEMRNSDETSIESHPKAQDMAIDFQKMAEEAKATEVDEEEVPATQVSPQPPLFHRSTKPPLPMPPPILQLRPSPLSHRLKSPQPILRKPLQFLPPCHKPTASTLPPL
jgi:hypothetical protein